MRSGNELGRENGTRMNLMAKVVARVSGRLSSKFSSCDAVWLIHSLSESSVRNRLKSFEKLKNPKKTKIKSKSERLNDIVVYSVGL